jgi:hypothetical protein
MNFMTSLFSFFFLKKTPYNGGNADAILSVLVVLVLNRLLIILIILMLVKYN